MAKKAGLTSKLMPAAAIGAGAIAAGFVTSKIPVPQDMAGADKVRAAVPLALGIFLMTRKGIIADLGAGMVAGGALKLAQSFGIGAIDETTVMELDEIDTVEVEGVDDDVVSGTDSEEDEMYS
jgi:hypothetical protein